MYQELSSESFPLDHHLEMQAEADSYRCQYFELRAMSSRKSAI